MTKVERGEEKYGITSNLNLPRTPTLQAQSRVNPQQMVGSQVMLQAGLH